MKKQELMEMPHLAISEEKPKMFVHIEAEEGYKITDYFDNEDIKKYFSSSQMYLPIREEYENYRVITVEEDAAYSSRKEEELKKERELLEKEREAKMGK